MRSEERATSRNGDKVGTKSGALGRKAVRGGGQKAQTWKVSPAGKDVRKPTARPACVRTRR